MLCGLPWDSDYKKTQDLTNEEINRNLELSRKLFDLNSDNKVMLFLYSPFPGSTLYNRSLEIGLKVPDNLEEWANWVSTRRTTPWVTRKQEKVVKMFQDYILFLLDESRYHQLRASRTSNWAARLFFWIVYKPFEALAKFRWKYNFFALPLDFNIFLLGRVLAEHFLPERRYT